MSAPPIGIRGFAGPKLNPPALVLEITHRASCRLEDRFIEEGIRAQQPSGAPGVSLVSGLRSRRDVVGINHGPTEHLQLLLDIKSTTTLTPPFLHAGECVLSSPAIAFAAIENDSNIVTAGEALMQGLVAVKTAAGDDEEEHRYSIT